MLLDVPCPNICNYETLTNGLMMLLKNLLKFVTHCGHLKLWHHKY